MIGFVITSICLIIIGFSSHWTMFQAMVIVFLFSIHLELKSISEKLK